MAGGKIWEVGKGPRDWTAEWTQMLGDAQGPLLLVPKTGTCKQQHGTYRYKFLPNFTGSESISQVGSGDAGTWCGRGTQ